jgi:6-phosphogluconolactonase
MSTSLEIASFTDANGLAGAVASRWLNEIAAARAAGLPHRVALSGGRIAARLFAAVSAQNCVRRVSFESVHFFWADERCVPPTDPESNFRMAEEALLGPLSVSAGQIHRLKGEDDPESAAREASSEMLGEVPTNAAGQPVLDLVLLGMGEDGHVASLFPGAEVLRCSTPYLVIRHSPKPPPGRISLSYAAIAAARQVWVLASGAGKEAALRQSLVSPDTTPLGRVIASRLQTVLFTDLPLPTSSGAA